MDSVPERPFETIEVVNEHLTIRRVYKPDKDRCVAATVLLLRAAAQARATRLAREAAEQSAEAER